MMQDIRDVLETVNTIEYILGFDIFMLKKLLAAGYILKEPTYNTLEEVLKKGGIICSSDLLGKL